MVRREVSAPRLGGCRQHGLEISRTLQAAEHHRGKNACRGSDRRQALAAFGPPGVEHGAAAACLHAHEKSVRAGASNLGGLVGAFHLSASRHAPAAPPARPRQKR